ncbi:MAG: PKD domain-containing protein [Chitinophagales bacterium]
MKQDYTFIKNYFLVATLLFSLISFNVVAQAPQIEWAKCFGGSSNDRARDVHRTTDSGYVVCGFTNSTDGQVTDNHGESDGWIIKLDVNGNLEWQKTYGGSSDESLNAIRQLQDGGYVAVGYTSSSDGDVDSVKGGKDFWVLRTDAAGNLQWQNTFGGSADEAANDIASTADTGFVVVGYTFSEDGDITNSKGAGDGWLIFLDTLGNLVREKDKGGQDYDEFKSVITAENGGFLLVGVSSSNTGTLNGLNHGGSDAWLARLSRFGTDQWNALYGDSLNDGGFDVHENENAEFVVSGYRDFSGQNDSWLFTVDSLGIFLTEDTHGGSADELPGSSIQKTLSNYIVAGSSNSPPSGDKDCHYDGYDIWMYNTVPNNGITWQKCLGGTNEDISSRAVASVDGSIAICGYTNSNDLDVSGNHGDYDFWVVRLLDGCDVEAAFTDSIVGGMVSFTNLTFDGLNFFWTFGDGTSSTDINPVHSYDSAGTYTVCLISTSLCAADTFCSEIIIECSPATSGFTFTSVNTTVNFTATGQDVTMWQWDFGDGDTSSESNPVHVFDSIGTYNVCLIASNFCSADTFCQNVEVTCAPLEAAYTYIDSGTTVMFTSTSIGATSWKWKFGDGGNTNQENPTYTYADTGTYEVCLIVYSVCASDTLCQNIHVGCLAANSAFSFTQTGYSFEFMAQSGNSTSWMWTFGDGDSSDLQNPSHTYPSAGDYEVCLISTNECSSDTFCQTITVECPAVNAAFTDSINGLTVSFTDSSGNASSWLWTFGDGGTSSVQNPTYTYTTPGIYTVCVIAGNGCAEDTSCQEIEITCPAIASSFDYAVDGLNVLFTDFSNGATSWSWSFGDGNTSSAQNPNYTYTQSGTFTVCLTASNGCDSSTSCTDVTVECPPFNADFTILLNNSTASFTDLSGTAVSWSWTFGDGGTSNDQNPTYTYTANGVYTVCLVATDSCSTDSTCDSLVIIGVGVVSPGSQVSPVTVYPNPFSDEAIVSFSVTSASIVTLTLNDLQGRLMRILVSENLTAGNHSYPIVKKELAPGIYMLQLKQRDEIIIKRLVIE